MVSSASPRRKSVGASARTGQRCPPTPAATAQARRNRDKGSTCPHRGPFHVSFLSSSGIPPMSDALRRGYPRDPAGLTNKPARRRLPPPFLAHGPGAQRPPEGGREQETRPDRGPDRTQSPRAVPVSAASGRGPRRPRRSGPGRAAAGPLVRVAWCTPAPSPSRADPRSAFPGSTPRGPGLRRHLRQRIQLGIIPHGQYLGPHSPAAPHRFAHPWARPSSAGQDVSCLQRTTGGGLSHPLGVGMPPRARPIPSGLPPRRSPPQHLWRWRRRIGDRDGTPPSSL
jgi:hypothetical protein